MIYNVAVVSFDPVRPDFSPYGFSCVRWIPTRMPRCDRHNEIELNLLEEGKLVYLLGGRRVIVPAGRLAVFWAGVPHQILDFEGLTDYFVLTIPLVWFLQWRLPGNFTQAILHGQAIIEPEDEYLDSKKRQFELWSEDIRTDEKERYQASLLEIEARLRRLKLSVASHIECPLSQKSTTVIEQQHLNKAEEMASFIAQWYTTPLTAEIISRHVHLHPNYAMALFQQTFGTTLTKYVTQHRLTHAQRLLVTTLDSIVDIASNSGFGSLSHFNQTFRRAFSCTPGDYRRSHSIVL